VTAELARGGMGAVYRAQGPDGREVALKLLLAQRATNPAARRRFELEIRALRELRHPNLVPLLDAGDHEGTPWLALEFVAGETLEDLLHRGPLSIAEAIDLTRQLADALDYVHGQGLLHRDLKPANVLLRDKRALLTDFGLVLDEDSSLSRLTSSGVFHGTPGYWSPEQAQGEIHAHGTWTDVYGLGGVLFACLTGRPPVQAESFQDHLQTLRFRTIKGPRTLRSEVPEWLDALCLRCLEREPQKRPATAREVSRALLRLDGAGPGQPARRPPWRLGAAVGALAVVALGLALWDPGAAEPPQTTPPPSASEPTPPPADPDPAEVAALLREAVRSYNAGEFSATIRACDQALELDPTCGRAFEHRADAKGKLSQWTEALTDAERALALGHESPRLFVVLGGLYNRFQRWSDAIAAYDRALADAPDAFTLYVSRAVAKSKLGRNEEALVDCGRALALDPQNLRGLTNRGWCYLQLQRFAEALADYERAFELGERDERVFRGLGTAKAGLGRHPEAVADYTRALELGLGGAQIYDQRGYSLLRSGRPAEALADFNRTLAEGNRTASVYTFRGVAKARLKRYEAALADYALALELEPRNASTWSHRGLALRALERNDEALAAYARALELDPTHVMTWGNRGILHTNLGRHEQALADYDHALELEPTRTQTLLDRAHSLLELGRYDEALADCERALRQRPSPALADRARRLGSQAHAKRSE